LVELIEWAEAIGFDPRDAMRPQGSCRVAAIDARHVAGAGAARADMPTVLRLRFPKSSDGG
jgi:hypothetical protein